MSSPRSLVAINGNYQPSTFMRMGGGPRWGKEIQTTGRGLRFFREIPREIIEKHHRNLENPTRKKHGEIYEFLRISWFSTLTHSKLPALPQGSQVVTPCGHSFCRHCIENALAACQTGDPTAPWWKGGFEQKCCLYHFRLSIFGTKWCFCLEILELMVLESG